MSIKIMTEVWDSDLPRDEKFIALAYADWADDEGKDVYPSIGRVAWKTGYTEKSVKRITKKLIASGILVRQGTSRYKTNLYDMAVDKIPARAPWVTPVDGRPEQLEEEPPVSNENKVGDILSPTIKVGDILAKSRGHFSQNSPPKITPDSLINPSVKPLINEKEFPKAPPIPKPTQHPAVRAYKRVRQTQSNPNRVQMNEIISTVEDIDLWENVIRHWLGHGWNPTNVSGMLESYKKGGAAGCNLCNRNGNGNGSKASQKVVEYPTDEFAEFARANPGKKLPIRPEGE